MEWIARYRFGILWTASLGIWFFSWLSATQCNFFYNITIDNSTATTFGFFARSFADMHNSETSLGCVRYGGSASHNTSGSIVIADPYRRAGQWFAILTCLGTTTAFFATTAVLVVAPHTRANLPPATTTGSAVLQNTTWRSVAWGTLRISSGLALIVALLSFTILGSPQLCKGGSCRLTGVGALAVFNTFCLGGFVLLLYTQFP